MNWIKNLMNYMKKLCEQNETNKLFQGGRYLFNSNRFIIPEPVINDDVPLLYDSHSCIYDGACRMKEETLPALDNEDIRKLNTKRVVDSIENVGEHFKELKKQNRINFIVGLVTGLIILFILVAVMYGAFSSGGNPIDNIVDKGAYQRRFNCTNGDSSDIFRSPRDALDFKKLFPDAECVHYRIVNGEK